MCKVAGVTKITDKNRNDVWVFMQMLGQVMTPGNSDGLGYAAVDQNGALFGERWLVNESAFKDLSIVPGIDSERMKRVYSFFGTVDRDGAQAIILHTRAATCGRGIANTHPFLDDIDNPTVAIIHNGMIYNDRKFVKKYSTCDSEVLAHLYKEYKVADKLQNINLFTKKLEGWYTVLALSTDENGQPVLDAFTDSGRLGSYFIQELDTRIYSTYADDIKNVAKALGLTAVDEEKLYADCAQRISVETGEQIEHTKFDSSEPIRVTHYGSQWDGWGQVYTMEGNLDDENFKNRWFSQGFGYNGD